MPLDGFLVTLDRLFGGPSGLVSIVFLRFVDAFSFSAADAFVGDPGAVPPFLPDGGLELIVGLTEAPAAAPAAVLAPAPAAVGFWFGVEWVLLLMALLLVDADARSMYGSSFFGK